MAKRTARDVLDLDIPTMTPGEQSEQFYGTPPPSPGELYDPDYPVDGADKHPQPLDPHLEVRPSGIIVPSTPPGKKTLLDIKKALYPRHPQSERVFKKAGQDLTYIPWHHAVKILDKATGGYWSYEIVRMETTERYAVVAVRLTLHASDGDYAYDGQGLEELQVKGYGDPLSNAESMAFRRAAAKVGLGLYLYHKD